MAESQNLVRRHMDLGPKCTPIAITEIIRNDLCSCSISVDVHDKDWMERYEFHGLMHVINQRFV